jgi:hypothetical protein
MFHKFYVVAEDNNSKQSIKQELVAAQGNEVIPARKVEIVDEMLHSEHNAIAILTQEEADALMSDLRILDVHRDPYELGVKKTPFGIRAGNYSKSPTANINNKNWGLLRSISTSNNFGTNTTVSANVPFNLDGTGVDFVIIDTGVEPNHPEFSVNTDGTGGSRVVDYNWAQHGIIPTPSGGFLGDCDGHGSNCASIAAGNTCGWATGAAIYTLRSVGDGTAGPYTDITDGRTLELLDDFQIWQTLRAFHNAKPINPTTGYKRPTIVNCSFGFNIPYRNVTDINYRGSATGATTTTVAYGTIGVPEGGSGEHGFRYSALETEIADTIAAGVIIVAAAGNDRHKIDIPGGLDYNNYWTSSYYNSSFYYHRGSTPAAATNMITVGCIAALATSSATPEHKRNFSCAGPKVDIWAAGDFIIGAYANAPYVSAAVADTRSAGTYTYYLNAISGTSQAAPQVAGLLACVLQVRPWMNQQDCRNFLEAYSSQWLVDEAYYGGSGYGDWGSLQGGPARALYQPFNLADPLTIRG